MNRLGVVVSLCSLLTGLAAHAADAPAPPPYSLPWNLRSTAAATVLRSDTAFSTRTLPGQGEVMTSVSMLAFSYRLSKDIPVAPFARIGLVYQGSGAGSAALLTNPAVGASWAITFAPGFRGNVFFAAVLPFGMNGGNEGSPALAAELSGGALVRSAMDNAMFAVNDFTVVPGLGLSYSRWGFTVQLEATLLQLTRVKGEAVAPDKSRTNFTTGVHLGYFPAPWLSLGAELRYQTFFSTPAAVAKNPVLRDNLTFAVGPRLHLKAGPLQLKPGVSITVPFDAPMATQRMIITQVDVPVLF